jgi:hypothetical protein
MKPTKNTVRTKEMYYLSSKSAEEYSLGEEEASPTN